MGEVYRARDSRLDRTVAIKVLPERFASDPRLRERFEREAKAISALSHPHICTLYDVGSENGTHFLVMEYLEGESLADRLAKGPLPVGQVMRYGIEIAEALEKAHRVGIVHRDLKPGNVILTKGGAKLLDFGLAKLSQTPAQSDPNAATMAMTQKPLTEEGTVVGTFQYMAPEQIEGRDADPRTDLFALGVVLYEMTTGRRAFEAKTRASLIASILDRDPPPISAVQPLTPPALERVVKMCLAKDPDERWQSAHDVAAELKWIAATSTETIGPRARARTRRAWLRNAALLIAGLLAGGAIAWFLARDDAGPAPVMRTTVRTPASAPVLLDLGALAISPDGGYIVYRARSGDDSRLFIRAAGRYDAVPLNGTDNAHSPVFSPDGRWIAFFRNNTISKVPREGGAPTRLAESAGGGLGLSWQGDKIYATRAFAGGVWEISPDGAAAPRSIATTSNEQRAVVWPDALPGGETVLATVWSKGPWDDAKIVAFPVKGGKPKVILESGHTARYSPTGHLLFMRGGNLMAVPFDAKTLVAGSNPAVVVSGVSHGEADGEAQYAISPSGHLVYVTGGDSAPQGTLTWIDASGKRRPIVPARRHYGSISLTPDARGALVTIESATFDVWHLDIERDTLTRVSHGGDDADAVMTPDGSRVIWTSSRSGQYHLHWRAADNSTAEEALTTGKEYHESPNVAPDGKSVLYTRMGESRKLAVWQLPFDTRKPRPLIESEFNEREGVVSPDGRWLAWSSDESGQREIYVTTFPRPAGKWQVSTAGGIYPRWMPNGRELVYLDGRELTIVPVETSPRVRAGKPRVLATGNFDDEYSIAPDGRIAVVELADRQTSDQINLVLNFGRDLGLRRP
jgi:eukaryotic-like serine/threonine-protein kinase